MTRAIAAAVLAVVTLTACGPQGPAGTVVDRGRRWVKVQHDNGDVITHPASRAGARRCSVGKRWPECD
ncbi:hypothetical protein AB0C10_36565 [Microbispora amethystogenes]|uniref:hypothetical protein n=1 Tax=Microbispora amethystogenes TaxID=1427754 RepID=UPI00340D7573